VSLPIPPVSRGNRWGWNPYRPARWTLWSAEVQRPLKRKRMWPRTLVSLRFAEAAHGALILGPVGVGKTFLATALGHIAVRRRLTVHMARAGHLFKRLKAARLDNSTEAEHRRLAAVNLLIIDDFALQPLDETATTDFYELTVARHRHNATIVTSNRTPDEWLGLMHDQLLAQSAVDRLTSTSHELIIDGESYRKRQRPRLGSGT
jgi:DNA replication protein DnaC